MPNIIGHNLATYQYIIIYIINPYRKCVQNIKILFFKKNFKNQVLLTFINFAIKSFNLIIINLYVQFLNILYSFFFDWMIIDHRFIYKLKK